LFQLAAYCFHQSTTYWERDPESGGFVVKDAVGNVLRKEGGK
jgi:hypothetical protein